MTRSVCKSLLLVLMSLLLAVIPAFSLAQELTPIESLGEELLAAQLTYDDLLAEYAAITEELADLEAKYARDESNASLQDKLIDAMVEEETAAGLLLEAEIALQTLQAVQTQMQLDAECEPLTVDHKGKFATLAVEVIVDENMTVYGLTVEVKGSERDQTAGANAFLYQFIGKTLPVTIGDKETDDVAPAASAAQTSKDVVAALNSLVFVDEPGKKADTKPSSPIIEPQAIADYIFEHGELPDNFITKKEAQKLGWDSSYNYVSDVAPGCSIGGDRFGNYEGLLPDKKGRTWYEADCYYTKGKRNAHRILFSSDGLVYYTDDHYESFTQMFPSD